jgi:hypothetical protein
MQVVIEQVSDKDHSKGRLTIHNVDVKNAGVYRCQVTTEADAVKDHLTRVTSEHMNVATKVNYSSGPPSLRSTHGKSKNVMEGESAVLECTSLGSPRPTEIKWTRDGKAFTPCLSIHTLGAQCHIF